MLAPIFCLTEGEWGVTCFFRGVSPKEARLDLPLTLALAHATLS